MNTTTTKQIATKQVCVLLKNGIQLWLDEKPAQSFVKDWQSLREHKVMVIQGEAFSSSEIAGVFSPEKMDEYTRRKNNQWKCTHSNWHDRGEKCECTDPEKEKEFELYRIEFYKQNGYYPLK